MTRRNRKGLISSSTRHSSSDAFVTSNRRHVTTRWATHPRRLTPYPSLLPFNYLLKDSLGLFPPPSDECRQDRLDIRIGISDAASDPPLIMSRYLGLLTTTVPPSIRTWIGRVSVLPLSSVSPGCLELTLLLGTLACT